jgi:hypothetical protein
MESWLGGSLGVFVGLTLVLFGAAAFMTGRALAATWRPAWQAVAYCLLLAAGDRFLGFALFGGTLLSPSGYAADSVTLAAIALAGYRLTQAAKMTQQYPWLYERAGLFGWREKR